MIIPRHYTFIICLDLGLFMPCPCDLFFIFIIIFTVISLMNTDTLPYFLECVLLLLDDNVDEECSTFFKKSSTSGCCLAFVRFFANLTMALLIRMLLIKQLCITEKLK